MRNQKIKIDLRTDRMVYPCGYIGEKNFRTLEIIPPTDLKMAAYYMLAFDLDNGLFRPGIQYTGPPVLAKLGPPVTLQEEVRMTLEACNADGTILGKGHTVLLQFAKAASGQTWELATGEALEELSQKVTIETAKNKPCRVEFYESSWQGTASGFHILIPAAEHEKGIYARVTTAGSALGGGAYAAALPCWERQINGDILLKSDTQVPGEIFIERGN